MTDLSKSIEQLEKDYWKETTFPTPLVEKCHRYRRIPIGQMTIEQLRLMIGQDIGLQFLIPLAIEKLHNNILAEGDFYEGDLLSAVLQIERTFWEKNPDLHKQVVKLVVNRRMEIEQKNESNMHRQVLKEIEAFING